MEAAVAYRNCLVHDLFNVGKREVTPVPETETIRLEIEIRGIGRLVLLSHLPKTLAPVDNEGRKLLR